MPTLAEMLVLNTMVQLATASPYEELPLSWLEEQVDLLFTNPDGTTKPRELFTWGNLFLLMSKADFLRVLPEVHKMYIDLEEQLGG